MNDIPVKITQSIDNERFKDSKLNAVY